MVDWSAAASPRRGRDSIWLCRLERSGGRLRETARENLPTRLEARARLLALLSEGLAAGRSMLAGFDFPFGYPQGLAARLGLAGAPWRALWDLLAAEIEEQAGNRNNRFAVAARLNQRLGAGAAPFWGCPRAAAGPFLAMTHHRRHDAIGLAEHRLADRRLTGPQPVWKLAGAGSAGSQALTGIPVLRWLRDHPALARATRLWPFETGLAPPPPRGKGGRIVFCEIYPSQVPAPQRRGEVRDSAQVRAIARHFAALDGACRLAPLFAGDPTLTPAERVTVEREEGWTLGFTGAPRRYAYLREPRAIYRRSFALIRREADLAALPRALHAVALRLVHAAGEPELARQLRWSPRAVAAGRAALAAGAPILVDAAMVKAGIIADRLRRNPVLCFLGDRRLPALARRLGTTRSAAAVELWRPHLAGAIVAIGNAPTALFHLLELIAAGAPLPALVLGFPVGFVGAAEAKAALAENRLGLDFIALAGRRGGSALAAAAVNALAGGTS